MGLLDNKDALVQGLLGLGGGLLSNSSGHYGQFGPAAGAGIQGFNQNFFGAIQQQKDNEDRAKRTLLLERLQNSQIAENESQNRQRQFQMDQALALQQARARILGGFGGQPTVANPAPQAQGLGGFRPAMPAAPDPVSGAQIQVPSQTAIPQGMPLGQDLQAPQIDVKSKPLSFLQNPSRLREISTMLSNIGDENGAKHYATLADKVEAQQKDEQSVHEKIVNDAQGVPRYVRNGMPVFTGDQRKAPEGMQYNESGQLEAIPGFLDMKKEIAAAGKPSVNVQVETKQQTEEAKTVGKYFGEQYSDIQKAGFNAQTKIDKFNRLDQLLEGVQTGKLTPLGTDIAAYAKSMGFNIDDKLPNKEAAAALINAMALELRNPAGGAGMPGALSDSDRQFLTTMVPSLASTPEGRRQLIETGRKMAQRDKEVAKLARDYRKKHGSLDENFYDELEAFSNKNQLFGKAVSPEVQKLLDKYK